MKLIKVLVFAFIILLVCIQFFKREYNRESVVKNSSFSNLYNPTKNHEELLRTSCYDCHSNNTIYPWYSNVQPINIIINKHVEDGKKELNFDNFGNYSKRKRRAKLKSLINQIKDNKMPLKSYELMHSEVASYQSGKYSLIKWLETLD